jgi:hypothetical protein
MDRLDFDLRLKFQDEVRRRFKSPVHHPFPTPDGSFFMLVTFRCFLFRLTEVRLVWCCNLVWVVVPQIFMSLFKVIITYESQSSPKKLVFSFIDSEGSPLRSLTFTFIFGVMACRTGKNKNGPGN